MENVEVVKLPKQEVDSYISSKLEEISLLRKDGVTRIANLKNENANYRRNKQIDKETKADLISKNNELIKEAKEVELANKEEIKTKVKDLNNYINTNYKYLIGDKTKEIKDRKLSYKNTYINEKASLKEEYLKNISVENERFNSLSEKTPEATKEHKNKLKDIKTLYKQSLVESKLKYKDSVSVANDELHTYYLGVYDVKDEAFNKRIPIIDRIIKKLENYKYSFNLSNFFLNNGLYIVIILMLIIAVIYYAADTGQFLFSMNAILLLLNQVSPRMFFALGVAGLIVLAGTDLSIGRMIGMGALFTGMLVTTNGVPSLTFFGNSLDFSAIPLGGRVVLGFGLSIVACAAMSAFSGFFTAKFKMHPFVSTLATQLIIYGFLAYATGNNYTGAPDPTIRNAITGSIGNFPIMIIWAVIAIIVMWFIWNKTKFGKNMFAVGGNPEAASVSGINVFWVTMGVFILAGIYYGVGASIFGIYSGNFRMSTSQGMENDAIAACVVGGVSFSGGVGKISGVVIGALLFQAITVILTFLGINDANFQLFIKGIIIITAVALDCAKYLKKK